jgi:hypothetical protein
MAGAAGRTSGPNLDSYQPDIDTAPGGEVVNGKSLTVDSAAQATWPVTASVSAEVVQVRPGAGALGRISLGSGQDATLAAAAGQTYCTLGSEKCKCPPGSGGGGGGEGTTFTPMEKGFQYVAVTGGLQKSSVTVAGRSLDAFCKSQQTQLVRTWRSTSGTVTGDLAGSALKISGAAGLVMTIAKDGKALVNHSSGAPGSFTLDRPSFQQRGTITTRGTETATLDLKSPGAWRPLNAHIDITSSLHLTSPVDVELPGGLGFNEAGGGFYPGTWTITGKTLTVRTTVNSGDVTLHATWVWSRVK